MASSSGGRPRSRARAVKSMATTEKVFRDLLCEGRSLPAETSDPAGARTIDELRKQVKDLRAELEGTVVKWRQFVRDHERDLRAVREESERKLETTVESLTLRKDQERAAEIKKVEERLEKQKESELRMAAKEHGDEVRRLQRKWQHEKEEGIRLAVEEERRHYHDEFLHVLPEDEVMARENRLTKELFALGEQNERLEDQVKNLTRENRAQIELLRRMKHEYSMEVESVVKQNKLEASREMAQLQLAERIIAEKEHELHEVGAKADQFMMEKEFLEEELATVRTSMNVSGVSPDLNTTAASSPPPTNRRSVGGVTGVLQRRLEELEGVVKKLEEDKSELKLDNASLRKKLVQQQGGVASPANADAKVMQDNIVKLRKRNADLMNLTKKLDERCTSLKTENEQLRKQDSSPHDVEQLVRKTVARQHTKDIQEYMKQIHSKDKEVAELKRRLVKFEVASPSRSDSSPELEKKMRAMALEKLRMEKVISHLYSKLPDVEEVGVSNSEFEAESRRTEALAQENVSLKSEVEALHHRLSGGEDVDSAATVKQQLEQLEKDCVSLRHSKAEVEERKVELEQRCHELSQKLKISELNLKELEGANERCTQLESRLEETTERMEETERKTRQLEEKLEGVVSSLGEKESLLAMLEADKSGLEVKVHERDDEIKKLRDAIRQVEATPTKPDVTDVCVQATLSQSDTVESSVQATPTQLGTVESGVQAMPTRLGTVESGVQATPTIQPGVDSSSQTEGAELGSRTKTEPVISEKVKVESEPMPPARPNEAWVGGARSARTTSKSEQPSLLPQNTSLESEMRGVAQNTSLESEMRGVPQNTSLESEMRGVAQNTSLESEMRGVGIEITDPYDSSEGVGFSDSALDDVPDSTHSLEGIKDIAATKMLSEESQSAESAVPLASSIASQAVASEHVTSGGVAGVNLDLQEEEQSSEDEPSSTNSENLRTAKRTSPLLDEQEVGVVNMEPSVFIVKYNYDPSEMSPNPNHDQELSLVAGDYIYVYGEPDDDGFYRAQLESGEEGLVPSNFVELVDEGGEDDGSSMDAAPPPKPTRRRLSQLQDITEEEEVSSGEPLNPPSHLELERQFVEGDGYGVALSWQPPSPLPPSATGYNVYVNGELMSQVEGADKNSVIISGVPRKQLVKITVHTVSDEGESPAPPNPIILNPQYPDPPTNMAVTETTKSLLVSWEHTPSLPDGNAATSFAVYLNGERCCQVASSLSPSAPTQCVEIMSKDIRKLDEEWTADSAIRLTVRALADLHESRDSQSLLLTKGQVSLLLTQRSRMVVSEESSSSEVSMTSSEEDKKHYSPAKAESEPHHVTDNGDHVTGHDDHMTDHVTNGVIEEESEEQQAPVAVQYFRALYDYDPFYHSPNEEDAEDELGFKAGDIIIARGEVGEDGFLEGELRGQVGFAPSNMLEEITDREELTQMETLLHSQNNLNGRGQHPVGGVGSVTKMRAVYDYDPAQDSPNSGGSEVELAFTEGDVLTIFGRPDEDGYFQAELRGKKGLVPSNFLEEVNHRHPPSSGSGSGCGSGVEVFAADEEALRRAEEIIQKASLASSGTESEGGKKSGIFSRGKGLLSIGKKNS